MMRALVCFVNDAATTEIYTLSLHDALPISAVAGLPEATEGILRELARSVALHRRTGGRLDALPARQQELLQAMDEAQRRVFLGGLGRADGGGGQDPLLGTRGPGDGTASAGVRHG